MSEIILPERIDPVPIAEAVVEIRFETQVPPEAVFGFFYSEVKESHIEVKKLPILQLPEPLRANDPKFEYQAHFSLFDNKIPEKLRINIGPKVLLFANVSGYIGWEGFFKYIRENLEKAISSKIFKRCVRIGLRYINHFDGTILENINASLSIAGRSVVKESTEIRTELEEDGIVKIVKISNNIKINYRGERSIGSLIDIDCIKKFGEEDLCEINLENLCAIIDKCHNYEKNLFFSILKENFIKKFNPQYSKD